MGQIDSQNTSLSEDNIITSRIKKQNQKLIWTPSCSMKGIFL